MDISERMIKRVEEAYRKAKSAEGSFVLASELISIKSSSTIDIFSDRAALRVVDIAADSRKAVLDLYTTYQTEAKLLDEEIPSIS